MSNPLIAAFLGNENAYDRPEFQINGSCNPETWRQTRAARVDEERTYLEMKLAYNQRKKYTDQMDSKSHARAPSFLWVG